MPSIFYKLSFIRLMPVFLTTISFLTYKIFNKFYIITQYGFGEISNPFLNFEIFIFDHIWYIPFSFILYFSLLLRKPLSRFMTFIFSSGMVIYSLDLLILGKGSHPLTLVGISEKMQSGALADSSLQISALHSFLSALLWVIVISGVWIFLNILRRDLGSELIHDPSLKSTANSIFNYSLAITISIFLLTLVVDFLRTNHAI